MCELSYYDNTNVSSACIDRVEAKTGTYLYTLRARGLKDGVQILTPPFLSTDLLHLCELVFLTTK